MLVVQTWNTKTRPALPATILTIWVASFQADSGSSGNRFYRARAYYVADSAVTGRPALFRNGEEIAENVEDLQVRYGVDTDETDRLMVISRHRRYWLNSGLLWDNALAVRVSLRISSGGEGNLTEQPVTLNYDGNTFTAAADDFRLHQVFTTTVGIRNQLP